MTVKVFLGECGGNTCESPLKPKRSSTSGKKKPDWSIYTVLYMQSPSRICIFFLLKGCHIQRFLQTLYQMDFAIPFNMLSIILLNLKSWQSMGEALLKSTTKQREKKT